MDLRNWEFTSLGSAVVGADVFVYDAALSHPNPGPILASTTTNPDGMWSVTGLTNTAKDVKVTYNGRARWYKGMTRHSVGVVFVDDHETADFAQFVGRASVAAPGAATGLGRLYQKTDGEIYRRYEAGAEAKLVASPVGTSDIASGVILQTQQTVTAAVASTTAPGAAVAMGSTSVSITKQVAGSVIEVLFSGSFFADTAGVGQSVAFYLRRDAGAFAAYGRFVPKGNTSAEQVAFGPVRFTGLAVATYTFEAGWFISAGTSIRGAPHEGDVHVRGRLVHQRGHPERGHGRRAAHHRSGDQVMRLSGKAINPTKLLGELQAAGVAVNGLDLDGDELMTYDAQRRKIDLPPAARPVIDAHNPSGPATQKERVQAARTGLPEREHDGRQARGGGHAVRHPGRVVPQTRPSPPRRVGLYGGVPRH